MSFSRRFCVHGHFYQPPREDPWLGRILIESSAAPMRHWNERIVAESYGPMGWAHRVGSGGKVEEVLNCYEWISFNVGPTLMGWLKRRTPSVYTRILEADAASVKRWGHGNAMAQVYHHMIMPLASELDKELETQWAIADFEKHFGRKPEGMWLAESAVDVKTLEVLAAAGISFVILAPRQAKAFAGPGEDFTPVDETGFDVTRPYRIDLPSGASMSVFFYHAPLSQAVAFERLLENGDNFWNRINQNASGGLLMLATDGETYGHHFPFGEMALARVLAQGREERDGLGLTNPAAYLAANPPVCKVVLHEPSSWSCAHGVERWRSDCGCTDGGHPEWKQAWRGPLREALTDVKAALDEHFFAAGKQCFADARQALAAYGAVLADSAESAAFAQKFILAADQEAIDRAWKLLAMQEQALASFASCAWFFDDISRIEPVNAMTFMLRAIELAAETGGPDLCGAFRRKLAKALSNKPEEGTGADILMRRVFPQRQDEASLCLLALTLLDIDDNLPEPGEEREFVWPAVSVTVSMEGRRPGAPRTFTGKARIGTPLEKKGRRVSWIWKAPGTDPTASNFTVVDESEISVAQPGGERKTRSFAETPRRVREYVSLQNVLALQRKHEARAMSAARHVLSLMDRWEEAQHSMPSDWDWTTSAPYLLAACVVDAAASPEKRGQARMFVERLGIPPTMREKAWRYVRQAMLDALASDNPDWARLTAWTERAKEYLPELVLWPVQNAFMQTTFSDDADRKKFGAALGFLSEI